MNKVEKYSRKLISMFMSVMLVLALVVCGTIPSHAATYDVEKAMAYAAAHWNDGKGLCAEFVSACVSAGGYSVSEAGTGPCARAIMRAAGISYGDNYADALPQLTLDSNGNATQAANGNILHRGDVVVQYCNTHSIAPHIVICAGYNSSGKAVYYAHNGAMNQSTFNLARNTAYQHTTSCDMGGRVICLSKGSTSSQPASQTPAAEEKGAIADGTYYVTTKLDTNYVLDIWNAWNDDGINVQLFTNECVGQQQFKLTHRGSGYYSMVCVRTGKAVYAQGSTMYSNIAQGTYDGSAKFLWKPVATSGGYYLLKSKLGDMYMDVENAYPAQGTNIQLYPRNAAYAAQEWKFVPIASVTTPFTKNDSPSNVSSPSSGNSSSVVNTPATGGNTGAELTPVVSQPVYETPVITLPSPVEEDDLLDDEFDIDDELEEDFNVDVDCGDSCSIALTIGSSSMYINGNRTSIDNSGTAPVIRESRTMLPIRAIVEGMGGSVSWDSGLQRVTLDYEDATILLDIGSASAYGIDNLGRVDTIALDSPAFIENGRTFLPVRAVMEFFGASVNWNSSTQTISIYY